MKKNTLFIFLMQAVICHAQIDSTLLKSIEKDTVKNGLNMDAIYNRPFLKINKMPITIGGYVETNYQHATTDGVTDGHEFQFRRLSLFVASSISKRIKFLSEIEFEHDKAEELEGKPMEIAIEYAAMDIEFNPLLNLRSGIIVNPIGSFNQNHDGPKWEFTDRPLAMTQMLPCTFSNTGFGLYGKKFFKKYMIGYEVYLTGGFNNSIIDNDKNKTYLPQANENTARFVTSNSGTPLTTAKISARYNRVGELGISWMSGVYNKFTEAGMIIDKKRRADVLALDFNTIVPSCNTKIIAEWAWTFVQLPTNYFEKYGSKQQGGFIDVVQPIINKTIFGWQHALVNVAMRAEYVDWNIGKFKTNGQNKADDLWSIMSAVSFRPTPQTVCRINYRILRQTDLLGNPPSKTNTFQFGISTYF